VGLRGVFEGGQAKRLGKETEEDKARHKASNTDKARDKATEKDGPVVAGGGQCQGLLCGADNKKSRLNRGCGFKETV
jgi:hypothetical protein